MRGHIILSLVLLAAGAALAQQTTTNSIGMEFVQVPAGSFIMGKFEPKCAAVGTQGNVTEEQYAECVKLATAATRKGFKAEIPRPFAIGKFEVTQEQYQKVMGTNPSYHTEKVIGSPTGNYPVDSVTWEDAQAFIKKLNALEKTNVYRLPTEVEWEYAAAAGTDDDVQGGKTGDVAWFMSNSNYVTHPVGQKQANRWGIYDMLGNVWEWVQDYYDYDVVPKGPKGPAKGDRRVLKGGGFQAHAKNIRVSVHAGGPGSVISTGFRVVREIR